MHKKSKFPKIFLFFLSLSLGIFTQNNVFAEDTLVPYIDNLRVDQSPYNPSNSSSLTISFDFYNFPKGSIYNATISKDALLVQGFHSSDSNLEGSGTKTLEWDGRTVNPIDYSGKVVDGEYVFTILAQYGPTLKVLPLNRLLIQVKNNTPENLMHCAGFSDVSTDSPVCPAIAWVKEAGIMSGNPDGTFRADVPLERAHSAKIVQEAFNLFDIQKDYCKGVDPFPDVPKETWMGEYICNGKKLVLKDGQPMITGYKGEGEDKGFFRDYRRINRAEFLAFIFRVLADQPSKVVDMYTDVEPNAWYFDYAAQAKLLNLYPEQKLQPHMFVSRQEAVNVLYELHKLGKLPR